MGGNCFLFLTLLQLHFCETVKKKTSSFFTPQTLKRDLGTVMYCVLESRDFEQECVSSEKSGDEVQKGGVWSRKGVV